MREEKRIDRMFSFYSEPTGSLSVRQESPRRRLLWGGVTSPSTRCYPLPWCHGYAKFSQRWWWWWFFMLSLPLPFVLLTRTLRLSAWLLPYANISRFSECQTTADKIRCFFSLFHLSSTLMFPLTCESLLRKTSFIFAQTEFSNFLNLFSKNCFKFKIQLVTSLVPEYNRARQTNVNKKIKVVSPGFFFK